MKCVVFACLLAVANSEDGVKPALAEQSGFLQNPKSPDISAEALYYAGGGGYRGGYTTVQHQSWFSRMKDAFIKVIIGIILLIFSVPVLWVNEHRNATMECVISCGEQDCAEGEGNKAELVPDNGTFLHKEGEQARATDVLNDARFEVKLENTLRLKTHVEVFQWVENKSEETREQLGGGQETITTYSYTQEWKAGFDDGSSFGEQGHNNVMPNGLKNSGEEIIQSELVEYGSSYTLPQDLVSQLSDWQPADGVVGKQVRLRDGEEWNRIGAQYYYSRDGAGTNPQIGDGRVSFGYIPDGPVTVLALQVEGTADKKTFAPYRLVSRGGMCSKATADEVKQKLVQESKVSTEELAKRSHWNSPCCCVCNLVNMCFAAVAYPQIFKAWCGTKSRDECFQSVKAEANCMKWGFRIAGWFMMYIGLNMLFSPLITFLALIPFLAHVGAWIVSFFCFIISVTISFVIVCIAYMAYHPVYATMRLCIVVGIAAAVNWYAVNVGQKSD